MSNLYIDVLYTFLDDEVTEILVNEKATTNLDPDPERLSIHLRFSNMKYSASQHLSFKPSFIEIQQELTEIEVFVEMLTQRGKSLNMDHNALQTKCTPKQLTDEM